MSYDAQRIALVYQGLCIKKVKRLRVKPEVNNCTRDDEAGAPKPRQASRGFKPLQAFVAKSDGGSVVFG